MKTNFNKSNNCNKGVTLIELVLYIALFSIIIGGAMVTVFQIVGSSNKLQSKVVLQEESNFLLRKINWALNGATSFPVTCGSTPISSLTITNSHTSPANPKFDLNNGYLRLNENNLNSENVKVSNLSFVCTSAVGLKPASLKASFTLTEGESGEVSNFETTKYLRI